jgi:hypothetical protein
MAADIEPFILSFQAVLEPGSTLKRRIICRVEAPPQEPPKWSFGRTRSGTPIVPPCLVLTRIIGELSLQDGVGLHVITNDVFNGFVSASHSSILLRPLG